MDNETIPHHCNKKRVKSEDVGKEIGDEPYLIKRNHKKLIVSVSENRVHGIKKTIERFGHKFKKRCFSLNEIK